MDKALIEERKKDLLARREEVIRQLEMYGRKTKVDNSDYQAKWTEYGDKEDENAAEVEDFERNISLEETLEVSLKKIDIALKKIEDGSYGICEKCQGPIEDGRLKAFPSASACMKCKKANL